MQAAFLSEEWFGELSAALASVPPLPGDASLRLGQLVTDHDGERSWTIALEAGSSPRLERSLDDAEVVLVESYEAARALASGEATAAELLEAGEITLRGDAGRLVAAGELLEALGAGLRRLQEDEGSS